MKGAYIDAIRSRLAAATPGPYVFYGLADGRYILLLAVRDVDNGEKNETVLSVNHRGEMEVSDANGEFLASSYEDVDTLLKRLDVAERVALAASHYVQTFDGDEWSLAGGALEIVGLLKTRQARGEALRNAVKAWEAMGT